MSKAIEINSAKALKIDKKNSVFWVLKLISLEYRKYNAFFYG